MNKTMVILALLSLGLTGCVLDRNGGYGDRGYGENGWNSRNHSEFHAGAYGEHGYGPR